MTQHCSYWCPDRCHPDPIRHSATDEAQFSKRIAHFWSASQRYKSKPAHMKKLQLILDRRQPFFIPYHFLNSWLLKRKIATTSLPAEIYVMVTFDVENFWGMEQKNGQEQNLEFLDRIKDINGTNATYLIPGNLIAPLAEKLRDIEKENEIGLHGHHHELWKNAGFVTKKPIRDDQKKELILGSLSEFDKNGLKRPFSFRAPYMWCKRSDLKILSTMEFKVDSSDPAQNGVYFARNSGPIMRIPVSTNPFPYFHKKRGLVYAKFHLLNLRLLNDFSQDEFYQCIDQILRLQSCQKQIPHLVFLLHSWEFYQDDEKGWGNQFDHRGEKNYEILKERLDLLVKKYAVKYASLCEFKDIFEQKAVKKCMRR
jgi:peptidoglycan/xylan/chitin deacetylase (PgdA/CDA1 family)